MAQACFYRGCQLGPGLVEVTGLGLLPQRLLAWTWFHGGHWLGPAPMKVTGSPILFNIAESGFMIGADFHL